MCSGAYLLEIKLGLFLVTELCVVVGPLDSHLIGIIRISVEELLGVNLIQSPSWFPVFAVVLWCCCHNPSHIP